MSESLEQMALRIRTEMQQKHYENSDEWWCEYARRILAEQQLSASRYVCPHCAGEQQKAYTAAHSELERAVADLAACREVANGLRELLPEAGYLLGRDAKECPDWQFGVGDCNKPGCDPCRVTRCLNAIDAAIKEQSHE